MRFCEHVCACVSVCQTQNVGSGEQKKKKRTTTTRINVPGNALGAKQSCAMVQSGGRVARKLPCGKRPGGIG